MSEILQKINSAFKNKKDGNSETHLQDNPIESVETQNETEYLPETCLTENGVPWIQTKKEPESKSEINIQGTENPKFIPEKLSLEKQADVEGPGRLKETIDHKSKMINGEVKKSKNEEDRRDKTIKSMQETIDHQYKMIKEDVKKSKNEEDRRDKTKKSMQETINHQSKIIKEEVNKSKNEEDRRAETNKSMQEIINGQSKIIKEAVNKSKNEADRRAETIKGMQATIDQQSKMLNESVKKSKNEAARRAETIINMQETIDHKSQIIKEIVDESKNKVLEKVHSGFTPKELTREKQADVESQRRLKETIESKSKINKPIVLDTFVPNKDLQNYIDTYKYDPKDIEWDQSITHAKEDSNFSDEINFISKELNKSYSNHNASYLDKITTDGDYSRFIEKELILCTS